MFEKFHLFYRRKRKESSYLKEKCTKKFNIQSKSHNFKIHKMIPGWEKTCFSLSDNIVYLIFIIGINFSCDKQITIYNKRKKYEFF